MSSSLRTFEELQRESEAILNRYQNGESDDSTPKTGNEATASTHDSEPRSPHATESEVLREANVDVKTPPTLENTAEPIGPLVPSLKSGDGADSFLASLEALQSSVRERQTPTPDPVENKEADAASCEGAPVTEAGEDAPSDESALDRMPPPIADSSPTPRPTRLGARKATKRPKKRSGDYVPSGSLEDALRAVHDSMLESKPPIKAPTPVEKPTRRPLSDGIPKSVSEDLPKYPGQPRMRTCTRCGHETKLRNPTCQKCGKVDESLGILDAVIAGDLDRVQHILLAGPHLIAVRTSSHDWTLLHMAAGGGNPKMVELLIGRGACVNATTRDQKTPLHYAAGKGHLSIVKMLMESHADPDALYRGKNAAQLARDHHQHEVAKYLNSLNTDA